MRGQKGLRLYECGRLCARLLTVQRGTGGGPAQADLELPWVELPWIKLVWVGPPRVVWRKASAVQLGQESGGKGVARPDGVGHRHPEGRLLEGETRRVEGGSARTAGHDHHRRSPLQQRVCRQRLGLF